MKWTVHIPKKAGKQILSLPKSIQEAFYALMLDMQAKGPVQGQWPNYSKLGKDRHHCHIRKGKPCYVAVWEVTDKTIKLIEVEYVGTHERAPY